MAIFPSVGESLGTDKSIGEQLPACYAREAVLAQVMNEAILQRLEPVRLVPAVMVNVDARAGDLARRLALRYPHARVMAVDAQPEMCAYARHAGTAGAADWISAPAYDLPLADASVDLLCTGLALLQPVPPEMLVREWRRVLRADGLLMLAAPGPDTLCELRDLPLELPDFHDMHTTGDLLLQAGLVEPVVDVEWLSMTYRDPQKLLREMQVSGLIRAVTDSERCLGLLRERFAAMPDGVFSLTVEMVCAHAFRMHAGRGTSDQAGEIAVPLEKIRRLRG